MPPTGGILFHEFGPRAPGSAWGLLEFIDHYPRYLQGPRAVSHPTCCCSVSLGRCDRCALVRGSCADSVAQYDAGCAENAPDRSCLSSSRTVRCTPPRALPSVRGIRWAIRQLRFEGASILGLARQLGTTWNTVWSHVKPCLQAASDDPARFAGVQVLGVDEHVWHHQDRRRRGPHELTGIVDLTRGKEHSTARLSGPGAGQVWHRVQELVGRARKRLAYGGANRDARSPSRDSKNAVAWLAPRMQPACAAPVTSSHSPGMPQVRYAVASSKTRPVTADARGIPSITSGFSCAPRVIGSRSVNKNDSARPPRQMRHTISVEVAYQCAQHVRDVFHQATSAQGRRLAARLIESLPTCPIPEIAQLGRTLRKWKDALDAYFDTGGASNGPTEAINGHYRTRQTRRQRLPQPHQLSTPNAPHRRRPRCLHPHPALKSCIRSLKPPSSARRW